jgi:hypothetical protein
MNKVIRPTMNRFFSENDALIFEQQLFNFWSKCIDKRWFWLAFQALQKAGLTYYESDNEEMEVRERITLLAVIYYEYCIKSSFHESDHFNHLKPELINTLIADFSEDVNGNIIKNSRALVNYFDSEENVTNHLWLNCYEGANNLIVKLNDFGACLKENYHKNKAENWFKFGIGDIDNYDSLISQL